MYFNHFFIVFNKNAYSSIRFYNYNICHVICSLTGKSEILSYCFGSAIWPKAKVRFKLILLICTFWCIKVIPPGLYGWQVSVSLQSVCCVKLDFANDNSWHLHKRRHQELVFPLCIDISAAVWIDACVCKHYMLTTTCFYYTCLIQLSENQLYIAVNFLVFLQVQFTAIMSHADVSIVMNSLIARDKLRRTMKLLNHTAERGE